MEPCLAVTGTDLRRKNTSAILRVSPAIAWLLRCFGVPRFSGTHRFTFRAIPQAGASARIDARADGADGADANAMSNVELAWKRRAPSCHHGNGSGISLALDMDLNPTPLPS